MRFNYLKASLKKAILVTTVLLLGMGASFAQSVNLTAAATTTTLPDGTLVHMWGYSCNDAGTAPATCAALNPTAATAGKSCSVVLDPGSAYSHRDTVVDRSQAGHLSD